MARSLDEIFGSKSSGKSLEEIFAPPKLEKPKMQMLSAHAPAINAPLPGLSSAWHSGISNSAVGGLALNQGAKALGSQDKLNQMKAYQPRGIPEKAVSFLATNLADAPLWAAGEAAIGKLAAPLTKTKPIQTIANKLPKPLAPIIGGGIKDAATYGSVVAPVESIANNEGLQGLKEREKQLPAMFLGGAALRGVGAGIGKGVEIGQNKAIDRKINSYMPELINNPLKDVQTAYKTPSYQEVLPHLKQREYEQIMANVDAPSTPNNVLRASNPSEYFGKTTQADLESVFTPRKTNRYKFSTGEQRALDEYNQGIQTAQNYIGHNDILAAYPPGTSVERAYADIKANTGVDIPKLTENLQTAQNRNKSLTPERLQTGRAAGVIPNLKPRETPRLEPPQIEQSRLEVPKPEPRTWTNKEFESSYKPVIKSITDQNVNQVLGSKSKIEVPRVEPKKHDMRLQLFNDEIPEVDTVNPQISSAFNKQKKNLRDVASGVYRATINNTQGIDRTIKGTDLKGADNASVMASNARNAGGQISHIIDNGLTSMDGKKIVDKSIREAFDLSDDLKPKFDEYLFQLHNIDRVREGKPIFGDGVNRTDSEIIIKNLEKAHPEFKEKAKIVRETLDKLIDEWGVQSGLVSEELRDLLHNMYKNYVPTYRQLSGADAIQTKSRSTGPAKLINKAVGGDEPLITLSESIPMLIQKTVKAARKNEVYRGILEAVRTKDNDFAKLLPDKGDTDSLVNAVKEDGLEAIATLSDKALEADPKRGYLLTVMEGGKPVKLQINKELFDSLQAMNQMDDTTLNNGLQFIKKWATDPYKAVITGYNPIFGIKNIFRDIPTAYIQGTENNPAKYAANLVKAFKEVATNSPRYQEYIALGGGSSNYFNVEKGLQPKGKMSKVTDKLGAFNNFLETIPRFGEYIGTLERGGNDYSNKMQALYNAAEVSTNFARHGDLVKAADTVIPYMNAAFQGMDKFIRTMRKPSAWVKSVGVVGAPTLGAYGLNQTVDKEGYDQLDNRTKDQNYLFPLGDGKFAKMPKPRESGVIFGSLPERLMRAGEGQKAPFKGLGNTVETNFLPPINPIKESILSPALYNLSANKDFADRPIVPQYMTNDKRSPELQFDENTSEIAKGLGGALNYSPKKIDYLINSYTGGVGDVLQPLTTNNGQGVGNVLMRNFTSDANYNNEVLNSFYEEMDKARRAATDKNITENIPSKRTTPEEKKYNAMSKISREISDIKERQSQAQIAGDRERALQLQIKALELARRATLRQ